MKRVICGVGDDGRNVVLFDGPLRRLGFSDPELAASSEAAGEAMYLAWAAKGLESATEDRMNVVEDFNMRLAPGETRFMRVEIAPGAESRCIGRRTSTTTSSRWRAS